MTSARRQQRAVEGFGEPVEQTVRRVERAALQTQVVLGVAPEQPVQHVPGGAVVRAVQEMTRGCVWRIGRCPWQHAGQRGLAHLRRALAERAEPPGSSAPTGRRRSRKRETSSRSSLSEV